SEADRFSTATCTLLMTDSNRFWIAPGVARVVETVEIAVSIAVIAADADAVDATPRADTPSADAFSDTPRLTVMYSPAFAPIWKTLTKPPSSSVLLPNLV